MERNSTWVNLGTTAEENSGVHALMEAADLNYKVVARDLFVDSGDEHFLQVPDKQMIVRADTNDLFGIVSSKYQICQNEDALNFVEYIDGIKLLKAGQIGGTVWMIGALPEITVLGDKISPNLIFQNSHDGSCSIKTTICMLRMVCQNQFVHSFNESPATISIRHSGDLEEKLIVARETMSRTYDYVSHYETFADNLASKRLTTKGFNDILEKMFQIPEESTPRVIDSINNRRDNFLRAYDSDDNQNFKGTQWGLVNAYSDLTTHEEYARKTSNWEVNRFMNSLSPYTMSKFIDLIKEAA